MYYPTIRHPGGVAVPAFIGVLGIAGRFEFPPTLQVPHHGAGFSRKRASSMGPPALTRAHASSNAFRSGVPRLHACNAFRSGVPRLHLCVPAGLSYPALHALASIFCVPTALVLPFDMFAACQAASCATSYASLSAPQPATSLQVLATTLAGRRSYADKVSLSFTISAVVCSVPPPPLPHTGSRFEQPT